MAFYDGHTAVFGMDADTEPIFLNATQVSKAVNRRFRGGKNRQRPPFQEISLGFQTPEDEALFRYGNVQMVQPYLKIRTGRKDGLIVSVAGVIFFVSLVNENGSVYRIASGNDASVMHAFGEQAEEWYYIQDGQNRPIFWNGLVTSPGVRSDKTKKQMPVGTLMRYAHGRMFVTNQFNQMLASDIMFGKGFTKTNNVQYFTETEYWNEGGYFGIPSEYGMIGGLIVMPSFGTNLRGQGELVVFAENGAMSFDVSVSRQLWKDSQIQKTAMKGRGCIAPYTLVDVNGEAWYRTEDGWSCYSNDRIDLQQRQTYRKLTREVSNWLDSDTPHLRRYASHMFFDNRLLGTVSPQLSLTRDRDKGYGSHRYFRGIIAMDTDRYSEALSGNSGPSFDGLWTGVRPTGMTRVRDKGYAMSYDADGVNRLYELRKDTGNDNGQKKVVSFYITKAMVCPPMTEFNIKRISGGEVWVSEVNDEIAANVQYRADHSPCWQDLMSERHFGSQLPDDLNIPLTRERQKKWQTGSPDPDSCQEGTDRLSTTGGTFQAKVEITGNAKVDRMRIRAESNAEAELTLQGDCEDEGKSYPAIQCKIENDYQYLIVNG